MLDVPPENRLCNIMAVNVKCMAMIMMMMAADRGKQLRIQTPGRYREGGQGAAWTVQLVERVVVVDDDDDDDEDDDDDGGGGG